MVLAAVALFCCASLALAALDCSSIPGCTACSYVDKNNKGQVLMCTACSTPAYVLKPKKGRCGEWIMWGFALTKRGKSNYCCACISLMPCMHSRPHLPAVLMHC